MYGGMSTKKGKTQEWFFLLTKKKREAFHKIQIKTKRNVEVKISKVIFYS